MKAVLNDSGVWLTVNNKQSIGECDNYTRVDSTENCVDDGCVDRYKVLNVYCQYLSESTNALNNIVIDSIVDDAFAQMLLPRELHSVSNGSETGLGHAGSLFSVNCSDGCHAESMVDQTSGLWG